MLQKIIAIVTIVILLIGTQFLSTVASPNLKAQRFNYACGEETVNMTCRVFTERGVETITKAVTKNEKVMLDEQLNKAKEAVRIIHSEEAGFLEKKRAYAIIKETSIKLKQLGLLPEEISVKETVSLISGMYGKHFLGNRIDIYKNFFPLQGNRLFYPNAFCFIEATAVLGIIEITCYQFPIVLISGALAYLLVDCGWENTLIGKLFLLPLCLFLEGIYNLTYNMPKFAVPIVFFIGLPFGGEYCTLETWGLLGHWKIAPGFVGLAYGFIGIWLPKYIFGYTAGIIAKP